MKKISILGSTGSIGCSALDVVRRHPDKFMVFAMAAGSNFELLSRQVEEFKPSFISVKSEEVRTKLKSILKDKVEILVGSEGAVAVATVPEVDTVLAAMVGAVGLKPTYEALKMGKRIALANKETLVAAGKLMVSKAHECGAEFIPVDSEHSAVFQSLQGNRISDVEKIILTASGGPFRRFEGDLSQVTVGQALNHPNWTMGSKITIDSATMMNKGLEIIEAHWLFNLPEERIEVVIHPQSIIHSMVEYCDSSIMAQLGKPDMREAISYAFAYPERVASGAGRIDWTKLKELTFFEPDYKKFPLLRVARCAIKEGGSFPAAMNAANEVAVEAFLEKKIKFTGIFEIISVVMEKHSKIELTKIDDVFEVDSEARILAKNIIDGNREGK